MAFLSVLIITLILTQWLAQWTGNFPAKVSAISISSGQDEPPTNLTATTLSSTSIRVTWDPPEFATADKIITYNVSYNAPYEISIFTNDTTVVLIDLEECTEYFVTVEAIYNGITCGSAQAIATTVIVPDTVVNVTAVPFKNISSSTITVNWVKFDEQTGSTISYIVFYQAVSGPYGLIVSGNKRRRRQLNQKFTMNFTGPPGTLTNLNGSVTYSIQVAAVACGLNEKLIGNLSMAILINTSVGTPTLPRELNYGDLTKNSIFIMWQRPEPPNGLIQMYNVSYTGSLQYFDQETATMKTFTSYDIKTVPVVNDDSSSSINITDLRVGTEYQISVVAYTSAGPGVSANISVSTLPDAPPDPPIPQLLEATGTTAIIEIQQASDINGPLRYFAVIVTISGNASTQDYNNIGPYNETEANKALSNAQSYVYIADLVMISEINNYPYSYTLGDGSVSCNDNKGVNYVNVPLQPNTQYAIVIRAHTADDLFADSAPLIVTTIAVDESDDNEFSTGAAVAITIVVTFIVTALITFIITSLYYKHLIGRIKQSVIRQEGDSHTLTEDIKSNDANYATIYAQPNITMKPNPAYETATTIKMNPNPAYGAATTIKMDTNPAYATTAL